MKTSKLPRTDSIRAMARFWDTHDVTEFEDDLEEVMEPVFAQRSGLEVPLRPNEARAIKRMARAAGISQEELVRRWVLQKLANGKGVAKRRR